MNNLDLWISVEKTDPEKVKNAKVGGRQITSVDPQWQRKRATETFGPFGIGWGVENVSMKFLDMTDDIQLLIYEAELWYIWGDKRGSCPITSSIKSKYRTNGSNGYIKVDEDCTKKVSTNAVSKGLSYLGFSADVFLGKFDDSMYVASSRAISEAENMLDESQTIDEEQQKLITSLIERTGSNPDDFFKFTGVGSVAEIEKAQFAKLVNAFKKKIQNKASGK